MPLWIEFISIDYLSPVLLLVILVWLLALSRRLSLLDTSKQEITQSLAHLTQIITHNQTALENQARGFQQRLFESLMRDRESQLESLSKLRVELEQRFAEANLVQAQTLQNMNQSLIERFESLKSTSVKSLFEGQQVVSENLHSFGEKINSAMAQHQEQARLTLEANINKGITQLREELSLTLKRQNQTISESIGSLSENTDNRLKEISGQVEKRLTQGFDKTNQTFADILKRLALIDDAQKKLGELSSNVVSLQEVLNDKRSRGAFGEIQLQGLVANTMPESHYQMQKTLSNGKIADCVLMLPEPTGHIAIDSKFPLENYQRMMDIEAGALERKEASRCFVQDIKKHINAIADKYIIPPETAEGAVMFIPAESVFAEIHGHYPQLVELAYQRKVWLVSPTTFMAILTTASAVVKDQQTRQQVHVIKQHLTELGRDFDRFQGRMDKLSRHIGQVSKDVEQVHVSARKISSRFDKIEKVELSHADSQEQAALES